jgi:hypothetical protein
VKLELAVENRHALKVLLYFFVATARLMPAQGHAAPTAPASGPVEAFVDATHRLGVDFHYQASHHSKKYLPETMGAGVAPLKFRHYRAFHEPHADTLFHR